MVQDILTERVWVHEVSHDAVVGYLGHIGRSRVSATLRGSDSTITIEGSYSFPIDINAEYEVVVRKITKPGVDCLRNALKAAEAGKRLDAVAAAACAIKELT